MGHVSENDRTAGACDECGDVYPVHISEDNIIPIGIGECKDCGGTEFTLLGNDSSQASTAED